jgi:palmitoyltransferase ZDHHC9/14/18
MFLCGGRIMIGSQNNNLILTVFLIILTWSCYFAIVLPLQEKVFLYSIKILRISTILNVVNLFLLLITACTEPGIKPRCSKLTSFNEIRLLKNSYCNICNIYKNQRTKHCRFCNNCVEVFVHHCPVYLFWMFIIIIF